MAKRETTWSFKEVDQHFGVPKGTAFRAFKQLENGFDEGNDFYYLSSAEDTDEIDALRDSGRIYGSTVNAVLLCEPGYEAIAEFLEDA